MHDMQYSFMIINHIINPSKIILNPHVRYLLSCLLFRRIQDEILTESSLI